MLQEPIEEKKKRVVKKKVDEPVVIKEVVKDTTIRCACGKEVVEGTTKCESHTEKLKDKYTIKKNKYGNSEYKDTGLVFDNETKEVYGKQAGDKVLDLTEEDIEECKRLRFRYRIPIKLSSKEEKPLAESDDDEQSETESEEEESDEDEDSE